MKKVDVKFAKLNEDAIIPSKTDENAGYDLYASFKESFMKIPAHETVKIPTGIASAIEKDYYFQIEERSSTGSKGIKKSAGVIDSGYRGEWLVAITNSNDNDMFIAKEKAIDKLKEAAELLDVNIIIHPYKKAIAQMIIHKVEDTSVNEISYEELKEIPSERKDNGFGSTDK